ncbi:MAG TPA: hypothetical protein VFS43_35445 [Polyangiaceae bacterium]|nr:hypothetical protein [Polyangiaceae bacterium]
MSERLPTLLRAGSLAALVALAGGCYVESESPPLPPPPPPDAEEFSTPFQPAGGGDFVAASHRHRTRVTSDGTLYLYLPQGEDRPGVIAALGTQLHSMQRDEALDTKLRSGGQLDRGAVRFDRGAVVEVVRNTRRGVEQGWVFSAAPEGEGDLVVRIRTEGVDAASLAADGIHFRNNETGMRALIEDATWADARGRSTRVPARYEGGVVVLRVPASVVDASTYPVTLKLAAPEAPAGRCRGPGHSPACWSRSR